MTLLSRPEDVPTDASKDKPLPKHKQVLLRFTRGKDHVMRNLSKFITHRHDR